MAAINISSLFGEKYSMLTIVGKAEGRVKEGAKVVAICDCGKEKVYRISHILDGSTKSCGCFRVKVATKHGLVNHPLYSTYYDMMQRCYNKNSIGYDKYGGEGVVVCDEWQNNFVAFYDWCINNGWENGLELDKDILSKELGVSKRYSPQTCQFVTSKVNSRHRSDNVILQSNGESKCITDWAEGLGISQSSLRERLLRGWPIDKAVSLKKNTKIKWL